MLRPLARLYANRIVNINVNICAAAAAGAAFATGVVHLTRYFTDHKLLITAVGIGADALFDFAVYYLLHWLANHWRRTPVNHFGVELTFFRDATLVQFERLLLGPLYYGVMATLMLVLLKHGSDRNAAFLIAAAAGLAVTRGLHTVWLLFKARRERRQAAAIAMIGAKAEAASRMSSF